MSSKQLKMSSNKRLNLYSNQLNLLLSKHFQIQKRSIIGLLLKLIIPAIFAIILMPIRTVIKSDSNYNDTTYKSFNLENFGNSLPLYKNSSFAYCPNSSNLVNNIMMEASETLNLDFKCKKCF